MAKTVTRLRPGKETRQDVMQIPAKDARIADFIPNGVSYAEDGMDRYGAMETRGNGAATKGRKARGPMA
jgi:hypothetical protein